MIRVNFAEPSTKEWMQWKDRLAAVAARVNRNHTGAIRKELYTILQEAKDVYRKGFHQKCAYCEAPITDDARGNIGHYRPPWRVFNLDGDIAMIHESGQMVPHPGYFWLAYETTNLLYVCVECQLDKNREPDDRFPVSGDEYQWQPQTIGNEARLLLNPLSDDPEKSLGLDLDTGTLYGFNDRAHVSIEKLKLNREGLRDARLAAYQKINEILVRVEQTKIETMEDMSTLKEAVDVLLATTAGRLPYCFVARRAWEGSKAKEKLKMAFGL